MRGRETSMCGCLWHSPYWGPGLQPSQVVCLGIEPVTFWFAAPHSIHWATPPLQSIPFSLNRHIFVKSVFYRFTTAYWMKSRALNLLFTASHNPHALIFSGRDPTVCYHTAASLTRLNTVTTHTQCQLVRTPLQMVSLARHAFLPLLPTAARPIQSNKNVINSQKPSLIPTTGNDPLLSNFL